MAYKDLERQKEVQQRWRDAHPNYMVTYGREYQRLEKSKAARRRIKYGITPEQYEAIRAQQNNLCAICKQPQIIKRNGQVKTLCVDHDHTTEQVRGLLCDHCNKALGCMRDDVVILQSAIDYLKQYKKV